MSVRFLCGLTRKRRLTPSATIWPGSITSRVLKRPLGPARPARGRTRDRRSGTRSGRRSSPSSAARSLRLDVEVPEDLEMVGDEPDRADEDALHATGMESVELVEDVRAEPRLAGRRSRSGRRTTTTRGPRASATSCDVSSSWSLVRVALVEDPRRKAVSGEDHVRVRAADPVGEHVQVRLVVVPALDEPELGAACEALLQPLAVAVDREASSSAARGRGRRWCPRRPRAPARPPPRFSGSSASCRRRRESQAPVRAPRAVASVTSSSGERPPIRR